MFLKWYCQSLDCHVRFDTPPPVCLRDNFKHFSYCPFLFAPDLYFHYWKQTVKFQDQKYHLRPPPELNVPGERWPCFPEDHLEECLLEMLPSEDVDEEVGWRVDNLQHEAKSLASLIHALCATWWNIFCILFWTTLLHQKNRKCKSFHTWHLVLDFKSEIPRGNNNWFHEPEESPVSWVE